MKLVHLSDLHFGCERDDVVESLLQSIAPAEPDLIVISGDLTQRARSWQFKAARAFLNQLSVPWLCVPGNHDLPLFNLASRFITPFRGYKQYIHPKTNVCYIGNGSAIYGFNTTGRVRWKLGRFTDKDMAEAKGFFSSAPAGFHKVLVVHHPCLPFEKLDADLVLCGHLHMSSARVSKVQGRTRDMIVVAAGTAVSKRERGEANSYNEMILKDNWLCLRVHAWNGFNFTAGNWVEYPYHSTAKREHLARGYGPTSSALGYSTETGPRSI